MNSTEPPIREAIGRRTFFGRMAACLPILLGTQASATTQSKPPHARAYYQSSEEPEALYDEISQWQQYLRVPVWEDQGGNIGLLIEAIRRNEALYGNYERYGDSHHYRRITPLLLFRTEFDYFDAADKGIIYEAPAPYGDDIVYLQAWDHDKQAQRTFHADKLNICVTAPWMRRWHDDLSHAQWQDLLRRTEQALQQQGVKPV